MVSMAATTQVSWNLARTHSPAEALMQAPTAWELVPKKQPRCHDLGQRQVARSN